MTQLPYFDVRNPVLKNYLETKKLTEISLGNQILTSEVSKLFLNFTDYLLILWLTNYTDTMVTV